MNLAFATTFPKGKPGLEGKPTYFIEKIWTSFINTESIPFNLGHYEEYHDAHQSLFGCDFGYNEMMINPKIHTMRSDIKDRWKRKVDIHFIINNRRPDRFQFAPVIPCSGIEKVRINWELKNPFKPRVFVFISDILFCDISFHSDKQTVKFLNYGHENIKTLSNNDGFDSIEEFFMWFNEDFTGKIIHWTPFRYVPEAIEVKEAKHLTN